VPWFKFRVYSVIALTLQFSGLTLAWRSLFSRFQGFGHFVRLLCASLHSDLHLYRCRISRLRSHYAWLEFWSSRLLCFEESGEVYLFEFCGRQIPAVLDPAGREGGRFVAWFWAWFWICLLTSWTFDTSGNIIGATCLPPTARSDNSFERFVYLIVLLSLWPIWVGTVRGFGVLFKARVDLVSVDGDGALG
jgi:hypothetical protein